MNSLLIDLILTSLLISFVLTTGFYFLRWALTPKRYEQPNPHYKIYDSSMRRTDGKFFDGVDNPNV